MATKFRYPTGARPLLIEEAARRRRIELRFVEILERAGFAEVILPIIDYAEPYAAIARGSARDSYRFVDRDGELVAIRSDFTPMVARALAPAMSSKDLPLRVFYRGDVIRCEASRLGANRELFQIGAEIVGDPSIDADIAVLQLAADIVRAFDAKPLVVYSDASLTARFDDPTRIAVATKRMRSDLPPLAQKLIAGTATLDDVESDHLAAIERALDRETFELHLDDVEATSYYTGLRFQVFDAATRVKLAQGGRYDNLYERFGTPAAAIGFTFTIDDLD